MTMLKFSLLLLMSVVIPVYPQGGFAYPSQAAKMKQLQTADAAIRSYRQRKYGFNQVVYQNLLNERNRIANTPVRQRVGAETNGRYSSVQQNISDAVGSPSSTSRSRVDMDTQAMRMYASALEELMKNLQDYDQMRQEALQRMDQDDGRYQQERSAGLQKLGGQIYETMQKLEKLDRLGNARPESREYQELAERIKSLGSRFEDLLRDGTGRGPYGVRYKPDDYFNPPPAGPGTWSCAQPGRGKVFIPGGWPPLVCQVTPCVSHGPHIEPSPTATPEPLPPGHMPVGYWDHEQHLLREGVLTHDMTREEKAEAYGDWAEAHVRTRSVTQPSAIPTPAPRLEEAARAMRGRQSESGKAE